MSELTGISKLLLNPISIGVIIAILGYIVKKNHIDSFLELRKAIKESRKYVYRTAAQAQNFYRDPKETYAPKELEKMDEIDKNLKDHAANLDAGIHNLNSYGCYVFWNLLPSKKDMLAAVGSLNKISDFQTEREKDKIAKEIANFNLLTRMKT